MVKIYAKVLPEAISNAIKNVNRELRKYAPEEVVFVEDIRVADFQWIDVIGEGSFEFMYLPLERTIPLFYCYLSGANEGNLPAVVFKELLTQSPAVVSYYPLDEWNPDIGDQFIRTPLGVDTNIFRKTNFEERTSVLTTGYVTETEFIKEFYQAAMFNDYDTIHIGGNYNFGKRYTHYEDLSIEGVVELYNQSKYCNAMRFLEGFELSNIEGILCGSRPICLDYPMYRYWFNDTSIFVPESHEYDERVLYVTEAILTDDKGPVTDAEIESIANRFNSKAVYTNLWQEILGRIR